ncbi:hypothetical protein DPMN_054993 [Dreissena polymorpha]|uniref:Uncharacterized protein n=2 Tax=Dreissena polymorpha TaxID=45954 RepID=A0A9D4CP52_DREPO|nr:hypothetical protein DPMN_054993 [Dreissena polymorpha]
MRKSSQKTLIDTFVVTPYTKRIKRRNTELHTYSRHGTNQSCTRGNVQQPLTLIVITFSEGHVVGVKRAKGMERIMGIFKGFEALFMSTVGVYLLFEIPQFIKDMQTRGLFKQQGLFDDINSTEFIIWRQNGSGYLISQDNADSSVSFKRLRAYLGDFRNYTCVPFHDLKREEPVKSLDAAPEIPLPLHQRLFPNERKQYVWTTYPGISKERLDSEKAEIVTSGSCFDAPKILVKRAEDYSHNNVANSLADSAKSIPESLSNNTGQRSNSIVGLQSDTNASRHVLHCGQLSTNSKDVRKPPRYPRYTVERNRFESFSQWPHDKPTPKECVESGFFYTGDGDMLRCFQCGIGLKDFSTEDNPVNEHIKHSGTCQYLLNLFGEEYIKNKQDQLETIDPDNIRCRQYAEFQRNRGTVSGNRTDRSPEYKTLESRIVSYESSNFRCAKRPYQLAEAGFFYTGIGDHFRCFSCNGGLRNWENNDDPWTEHCKWFPACRFAKETKGEAFIEHVQQMDKPAMAMMNSAASSSTTTYPINCDQDLVAIKIACIEEMGFSEDVFDKAVYQLKLDGYNHPQIDDVINRIALIQTEMNQTVAESLNSSETIQEENQRLKSMLICCKCSTRNSHAPIT